MRIGAMSTKTPLSCMPSHRASQSETHAQAPAQAGACELGSNKTHCAEAQAKTRQDTEMQDATHIATQIPDWLRPLQKTIVCGAAAIIVTLIAVPLWLYEEGKGSLVRLEHKIDRTATKVEAMNNEVHQLKSTMVPSNAALDQRLINLEAQVDHSAKSISRVEGSLETVISLLE